MNYGEDWVSYAAAVGTFAAEVAAAAAAGGGGEGRASRISLERQEEDAKDGGFNRGCSGERRLDWCRSFGGFYKYGLSLENCCCFSVII